MQGIGVFVGFFALLIILALASSGEPLFSTGASERSGQRGETIITPYDETERTPERASTAVRPSGPVPVLRETRRLSNQEIEHRLATIYRRIKVLKDRLESALLREPASPHAGTVKLLIGNARATDPEREYLTLRAGSRNEAPVNISDWYLQSLVTMESAAIPDGTRTPTSVFRHRTHDILLEPGETAFLLTTESPIFTSFHENKCTGYLSEHRDFFPSLRRSCPAPLDEMDDFASIALDNDSCFEFVRRVRRCGITDEETIRAADLTRSCEQFIERELNYAACVENHGWEPLFDNVGSWRIYLDRNDDLWRREREIIRLIDENDRVVDVVEY